MIEFDAHITNLMLWNLYGMGSLWNLDKWLERECEVRKTFSHQGQECWRPR